ncbi:hypothetical protein DQ238_08150 [Geodermatophilus sp. TF02-6]|uniref:hypothetical protein n=1 Tax=Geodermatophilus sp. TF02-6 TaxID=2250575 RepID=UPI000DEB2C26|nr:hypothetical protein [Geodermatophilus sp. TF02-6]RBY80549.1 hypothetical protein DQ238_08150 [Geodermatophilus sp. TF02-6]
MSSQGWAPTGHGGTTPLPPHPTGRPWPGAAVAAQGPSAPTAPDWTPQAIGSSGAPSPAPDVSMTPGWYAPPPDTGRHDGGSGRRRTILVVAGVVLAVLGSGAAVLGVRALGEPDTPQEAAEAFLTANQRYDWRASWELLCHSEQAGHGSLDHYIRTQDAAIAAVGPLDDGLTVTVGAARPNGHSTPQSYVVDMVLSRGGESERSEMLVVEEDGGFRACGFA